MAEQIDYENDDETEDEQDEPEGAGSPLQYSGKAAKWRRMFRDYRLVFWIVGLLAVGLWVGLAFFSPKARLARRRRKSHSRIVSKTNRPMVRFSVRPPKE